jgi:hypothetical protein
MATRGWEKATPYNTRHRRALEDSPPPQKQRSKYNAVKTTVDGITFHSAKEARRYGELKALQKARQIQNLKCQVPYVLSVRDSLGHAVIIGKYVSDFEYSKWDDFRDFHIVVVEDVKGFKTPLYRWKKRHVEAQYGITIREI